MHDIIRSKTRRAILRLFFDNAEREYYLREIGRLTGYPIGNIRRDMLKLESMGLFSKRILGNLTLYSLNKKYKLYGEYKSLVRKTIGVERGLRDIAAKYKDLRFAFIYGSYATGQENAESDIDIVLIGSASMKAVKSDMFEYQSAIGFEINSTLYSEEEFIDKIREKNHFIVSLCKAKKIFLKGAENEFRGFIKVQQDRKA